MADACLHNLETRVDARLIYLEDAGRYMLEVEARCVPCGTRFAFLGMPMGLDFTKPACSVSRLEARLPVEPDPYATCMLAEPARAGEEGNER